MSDSAHRNSIRYHSRYLYRNSCAVTSPMAGNQDSIILNRTGRNNWAHEPRWFDKNSSVE